MEQHKPAREGTASIYIPQDDEKLPKATHTGKLVIGDIEIDCAVLDNGTRVLTQKAVLAALGRGVSPARGQSHDERPAFLKANNLEPFISDRLRQSLSPVLFISKRGGYKGKVSFGYHAQLLPQVCWVVVDADEAGVLQENQKPIAERSRILLRAFATVGIVALIDEATGYQEERDRDALQRILQAYINQELLPWTRRFPKEFYQELFRLRGWQYSPLSVKRPQLVGHLTNEIVYKRLPVGVLDELRRLNPVVNKGRRAYKHHQFLTEDVGNEHLEKHLIAVTVLMRASTTWARFMGALNRAIPIPDQPLQQELFNLDDGLDDLDMDE